MSDEIRRLSDELAHDPASMVFVQLAEALRRTGQLDHALRIAARGVERHPASADAHDLLARIAADRGELDRAFGAWEAVLRLAPTHVGARKGLGFLCFQQGRLEEAERAQVRDQGAVDRMSEEAARAAEGAPSGAEAVGSTAPPANAAARSPSGESGGAGLSLRAMIDRPIADRDGEPAGTVRDVLLGSESGGTLVLVEEAEGGAVRAVNVARVLPTPDGKGGYYVDLDRESITALPGFRREGSGWAMAE
jgi:tetratricopeptide (TPR) repeat protein